MKKHRVSKLQRQRTSEIASMIRNWRLNEGLSQYEFSLLARLHVNSVANIEAKKSVSFNTICACLKAMDNMPLSEFFQEMQ